MTIVIESVSIDCRTIPANENLPHRPCVARAGQDSTWYRSFAVVTPRRRIPSDSAMAPGGAGAIESPRPQRRRPLNRSEDDG